MKQTKSGFNPGWIAALMTAAVVALQMFVVPNVSQIWNGQLTIYLTVFVAAAFLLILLPLCRVSAGGQLPDRDQVVPWLGGASVMAGVGLLISNGGYLVIWNKNGITPPPFSAIFSEIDRLSLIGSLGAGLFGGFALLVFGIRWLRGKTVRSGGMAWATLLPLLWAFCRLVRYTESYTSTIRNAFSLPNAAMLILTLAFFLQLGRHLLGRGGEYQVVSLTVIAFGTGIMSISTPLLRILQTQFFPEHVTGVIQMADASDFCVGMLAMAVGCYLCRPEAKRPQPEPTEEQDTAFYDVTPVQSAETDVSDTPEV